jgi:hypothetical protein
MHEDLEQKMAELVAGLTPEQYERFAPALREFGLSIAEAREAQREVERVRRVLEQAREDNERVLEDLARAEKRTQNAFRLLEDAL